MHKGKIGILGRRELIIGLGAMAIPLTSAERLSSRERAATPRQTEGPFYPKDWSGDADWDLVRIKGRAVEAMGQVTYITGHISDTSGKSLSNTRVEIWQCDNNGRYLHPGDNRSQERDFLFQGRGRMLTDRDGNYRFRTIKPISYPGRTPHIHFAVTPPSGRSLITQMYVRGEPQNDRDRLLNSIRDRTVRDRLMVRLEPADRIEPGALTGQFNIVLLA